MNRVILGEQTVLVNVPKFDKSLKTFMENKSIGMWIFELQYGNIVWGNAMACQMFNVENVKQLRHQKVGDQFGDVKELGLQLLRRLESFLPWIIQLDNGHYGEYAVRVTAVDIDGVLHVLCEVETGGAGEINGDCAKKKDDLPELVSKGFEKCPMLLTIGTFQGQVLCQNESAKNYYDGAVGAGNGLLARLLIGKDGEGEAYTNMLECMMMGKVFRQQVMVPPFESEIWHFVTVQKLNEMDVLLISQIDVSHEINMVHKMRDLETSRVEAQKDRLVQAVSHELRTPLVGVIGLSDELLNNRDLINVIEQQEKVLTQLGIVLPSIQMIHQSGTRLIKLVNRLLDVSCLQQEENGMQNLVWELVKIPNIIQNVAKSIDTSANNNTIVQDIPQSMPKMTVNAKDIFKVIQIILENANQYTTNGTITIQVQNLQKQVGGCIVISIQDTGIGIREQDHDRIFDLFEQADNSATRKYGGAGVGLALAKKIIERHGGGIFVESTLGSGAKFTFSVPHRPDMVSTSPQHSSSTIFSSPDIHEL